MSNDIHPTPHADDTRKKVKMLESETITIKGKARNDRPETVRERVKTKLKERVILLSGFELDPRAEKVDLRRLRIDTKIEGENAEVTVNIDTGKDKDTEFKVMVTVLAWE
jgi:hypothetical protein